MVTYKEMALYSCEFKDTLIDYLNSKYKLDIKTSGIPAPLLMEEVYWNNGISTTQKQYIYYLIRKKHSKEFKDNMINMPALGWDWHRCGINIYDCCNLVECDWITKSYNIKYSHWVNRCSNCDHLLFCNDISCQSYMAFNKPVTKEKFNQLNKLSLTELKRQPEFDNKIYKTLRKIHKLLKEKSHNEI